MTATAPPRLGFYFDANRCIGCKSCESACREWNGLDFDVRWRQVLGKVHGQFPDVRRVNYSLACNNCAAAPCVRACPTAALYVDRELALVQLDAQKCIGCRYCEWACPYGALQFDAATKKVAKCTLCADRLVRDLLPACVTSCPTECLQFGDLDALAQAHPDAGPDFPGLEDARFAVPNLLNQPLREPGEE
jgi:anaerobic dimethyl sulfoxide reductase subunit B (iron-sulfur subunit)